MKHEISWKNNREFRIREKTCDELVISLCLDHLWTEPIIRKQREGAANKVFLSRDLIGQSYLCFLANNTLIMLPILQDIVGSTCDAVTFGAAKSIKNVSDASPCFDLGMIVILDQSSKKMSLYSGNIKVCGVHFSYSPSVQLAHISQEIATLHIGQAHDIFSRIFRVRIYNFFCLITKCYEIFWFLIFSNAHNWKKNPFFDQ